MPLSSLVSSARRAFFSGYECTDSLLRTTRVSRFISGIEVTQITPTPDLDRIQMIPLVAGDLAARTNVIGDLFVSHQRFSLT
jgi:hypothetical protein